MKKYYQGKKLKKNKAEIKKENRDWVYWNIMADAYIKLYDEMLKENERSKNDKNN